LSAGLIFKRTFVQAEIHGGSAYNEKDLWICGTVYAGINAWNNNWLKIGTYGGLEGCYQNRATTEKSSALGIEDQNFGGMLGTKFEATPDEKLPFKFFVYTECGIEGKNNKHCTFKLAAAF
jgi:hypothetical protein